MKQSVRRGQHPKGRALQGHGRTRQVCVVSETQAGGDREGGHPPGVDPTFAGETEELVEEVLDAGARGEGDADQGSGSALGRPGVRGARRHRHRFVRSADRLLATASQEDMTLEDPELLLL